MYRCNWDKGVIKFMVSCNWYLKWNCIGCNCDIIIGICD